ncbi:SDR family NAD(P)-dependent oxidoreductase [Ignatzschineria rhizosphaerae]|uniref:SDR family NAD(P)-dependent oxidoreductase n=1 Tax=Ignatzschineria rhizosphaerae TaxID=2923279 RepID=A0ABY3X8C7_9GAMM|nr:SDR family NAD(P)-dependent oxidoreductase [Ignatzschineria rhizosphaerae]UNM97312.1 SDR family NAD(P)-dependent oxidoreductase [Ignatzschineria rhizosphaerae]
MKIFIITGASKGIGNALATILESEGHKVLRIARSNPDNLSNLMPLDITTDNANTKILKWLKPLISLATEITLINNAGMIGPIEQIGQLDNAHLEKAIALNVIAPISLTNDFAALTQDLPISKNVINISSGAGRHVYSGWSIYCTTKAAIDQFTRAMHVEQTTKPYPIYVSALAPGVIDTDMQVEIRGSKKTAFPNIDRFVDLKENGNLLSPHESATMILNYLNSPLMKGDNPIADVRDI